MGEMVDLETNWEDDDSGYGVSSYDFLDGLLDKRLSKEFTSGKARMPSRDPGRGYWAGTGGKVIAIKDMYDGHLVNSIKMLIRWAEVGRQSNIIMSIGKVAALTPEIVTQLEKMSGPGGSGRGHDADAITLMESQGGWLAAKWGELNTELRRRQLLVPRIVISKLERRAIKLRKRIKKDQEQGISTSERGHILSDTLGEIEMAKLTALEQPLIQDFNPRVYLAQISAESAAARLQLIQRLLSPRLSGPSKFPAIPE